MSICNRQNIITELADALRAGRYGKPQSPFPTVRTLAETRDVSLVTAHRIVSALAADGLIERRGRNMVVAAGEPDGGHKIGVLVPDLDNPFFSRLLNAIESAGREHGVATITAGSDYNIAIERKQLQMFLDSGATALLICPTHDRDSAAALAGLRQPFVLLARGTNGIDADTVQVDHFTAGELVAEHLLRQNCGEFFYIAANTVHRDPRRDGFAERLNGAGVALDADHCIRLSSGGGDAELEALFRRRRKSCRTGIFCYHDLLAMRVIRATHLRNLAIPEEVAVVGFDNLPLAAEVYPPLSSVSYSIADFAEAAVSLLLRRLAGDRRKPELQFITPELVVRQSSCPPPDGTHR